jgi:hypothetical protein
MDRSILDRKLTAEATNLPRPVPPELHTCALGDVIPRAGTAAGGHHRALGSAYH